MALQVIALTLNTGTLKWYFQQTHHDVWDFDSGNQPVLFDMQVRGQRVKALAEASKNGFLHPEPRDGAAGAPHQREAGTDNNQAPRRAAVADTTDSVYGEREADGASQPGVSGRHPAGSTRKVHACSNVYASGSNPESCARNGGRSQLGDLLWKYNTGAGVFSSPSVYLANGEQFVTVGSGGGERGRRGDDLILSFALPKQ